MSERHNLPNIDLLSKQEEVRLAKLMRAGDTDARAKLIEANMRLVIHIAGRYRERCKTYDDFQDIIQIGFIGLIKAADKFDPSMGCRFSTHAGYWIEGEMRRAVKTISHLVHISRCDLESLSRALDFQDEFYNRYGYYPTTSQIADHINMSVREYTNTINLLNITFFDDIPSEFDFDEGIEDTLPQLSSDEEVLDSSGGISNAEAFGQLATQMISSCPLRQQQVVKLHYEIGHDRCYSFEEIAGVLGMTRQNAWYNGEMSFKRKMLNDPNLLARAEELLSV